MSHDAFDDRRNALEEQFFTKQNEALVKKLKDAALEKATKETVQRLTGITNETVLNALATMHLGSAAMMVMSLFPLVDVAWADGAVNDKEREIVLQQAAAVGLKPGTEAGDFLQQWLTQKPELTWHNLWASYVSELSKKLSAGDRELLKNEVLGRARLVAEASGGFLGLGWTVSATEGAVLKKLEAAFAV